MMSCCPNSCSVTDDGSKLIHPPDSHFMIRMRNLTVFIAGLSYSVLGVHFHDNDCNHYNSIVHNDSAFCDVIPKLGVKNVKRQVSNGKTLTSEAE